MRKALNPRQERDDSVNHVTDFSNTSDSIPINSRVAELIKIKTRLEFEIISCETFLKSGNVIDGPNMDKPVEDVARRLNQARKALKEICILDIRDPEFEANYSRIRDSVFGENF